MTILDGIDETTPILFLQDPAICGSNADWADNYYQQTDWPLHGRSRDDCDLNEDWSPAEHGGFATLYTVTIENILEGMGYWWSLGGGGWGDHPDDGRVSCSQSDGQPVINGDFETQDLLAWSVLLGNPAVVPYGEDNYLCQMGGQSPVAISQTLMTPAHARFLRFDFAFPVPGDGDSLTMSLGGTTIFTFLGTDFDSDDLVSSGQVDILAFAGRTSAKLVFTLDSEGAPGATVLLDNVELIVGGDVDFDGDVDLDDFAVLVGTMTGPDQPILPPGNPGADIDGDTDCDLADFAVFQGAFTTPLP